MTVIKEKVVVLLEALDLAEVVVVQVKPEKVCRIRIKQINNKNKK
jgi:hypothetical protein